MRSHFILEDLISTFYTIHMFLYSTFLPRSRPQVPAATFTFHGRKLRESAGGPGDTRQPVIPRE